MDGIDIEGEPVGLLVEALREFEWEPARDGMVHARADLEPRLWHPLLRALLRIESELIAEDAEMIGTPGWHLRSYEQRSADALVTLADRMTALVRGPGDRPRLGGERRTRGVNLPYDPRP
jgi:hypothetical protein